MATTERVRQEAFVKDYCNNEFGGVSGDSLPPAVILAIDRLVSTSNNRPPGISGKGTPNDEGVAYTPESMSREVKQLLQRYRKLRWE